MASSFLLTVTFMIGGEIHPSSLWIECDAYEGFEYSTSGESMVSSEDFGWAGPWDDLWPLASDGDSLEYPEGTAIRGRGGRVHLIQAGARNTFRNFDFEAPDGAAGTYYMSFLARRGNSTSGLSVDWDSSTASTAGISGSQGWRVVIGSGGNYQIGASAGLGGALFTTANGLSPVEETLLVVSKMVVHSNNDREFFLTAYRESTDVIDAEEPDEWIAQTYNSQVVTQGLDRLRLRVFGSNNDVEIDEIRIGPTWQSVTGALPPAAAATFDAWRIHQFEGEALTNDAISSPLAAPGGDLLPNLLKFALGLNPFEAYASKNLFSLDLVPHGNGGVPREFLTLSFFRPVGLLGIDYQVMTSNDLAAWNQGAVLVSAETVSSKMEKVTYRDSQPVDEMETRFMKLRVEESGNGAPSDSLPMSYGVDSGAPQYPVPRLELVAGGRAILREGGRLFLDSEISAGETGLFEGHEFVKAASGDTDVIVHGSGLLYILTPAAGQPGSMAGKLETQGFSPLGLPNLRLVAEEPDLEFVAYRSVAAQGQRFRLDEGSILLTPIRPYELWDSSVPFPASRDIPYVGDLGEGTAKVEIHRGSAGIDQFLHTISMTVHKGEVFAAWKNTTLGELDTDSRIRYSRSADGGFTWSAPGFLTSTEKEAGEPVPLIRNKNQSETMALGGSFLDFTGLGSNGEELWAFTVLYPDLYPHQRMRGLKYNESDGEWEVKGPVTAGKFFPLSKPLPMDNGNWIMGGWFPSGAAVSRGDDFSTWNLPSGRIVAHNALQGTEGGPVVYGGGREIVAVYRNQPFSETATGNYPWRTYQAVVKVSRDYGESWSNAVESNFPISVSKPYIGKLSNGQTYFLFNVHDPDFYPYPRQMLALAVSEPGEKKLSRIYRLARDFPPAPRYREGMRKGPWHSRSYPAAVEHEGNLLVAYSLNKEDAVLKIIPIHLLE